MPWFERPFVQVLRREYALAMRFADDDGAPSTRTAPPRPCQLYVHVPFCEVLCPFCPFHRVRYREGRAARYFEALRGEIRLYHEAGYRFGDVYVGGGTPTVDPGELLETLELVRSLSPVQAISVETNPNHLQPAVLQQFRAAGVTRLSVGVQSFDDGLLRGMERLEKYGSGDQIRARLTAARGIFPTLNVDMMFNLPGQTLPMLERDLDLLLGLDVDQVSFYPLMTAPATRRRMATMGGREDPRLVHPMYQRILDRLLPPYRASSAWCFSRGEGMVDEYIIDQDDYVGVGSGAFSYVGGAMYSTTFSIDEYCRRVEGGRTGVINRRVLGARERMRYDFLVRLFSGELRYDFIAGRYGHAFWLKLAPELAAMRMSGAIRRDADAIRLTRRGLYLWVLMMAEFFNSVNAVREELRGHVRDELEAWNVDATEAIGSMDRRPQEARA